MKYTVNLFNPIDPSEKLIFAVVTVVNHSNGSMKGTKVFSYWNEGKDFLRKAEQYKKEIKNKLENENESIS